MKKTIFSVFGLLALVAIVVGFVVIKNVISTARVSSALTAASLQKPSSDNVFFDFRVLSEVVHSVEQIANSKIVSALLPPEQKALLNTIGGVAPDIKIVLQELQSNDQKWIFVFQNSNELRATGGFMGSYAIVEIKNGAATSIIVEDIYDADGQFSGYVEAPPGVKEYLSSGKGLRLPDANWHADTKASAEQILPFFALGNKQNIQGIVFVNLDFAKNLLDFLGPIELTDYNTIVTNDNIDEVLRSRRDEFFPGSKQKKHLLSQLLTQIRFKMTSLNPEQLLKLQSLVAAEIQTNNLQFYSNNHKIDEIFLKHSMRQSVFLPENAEYLYLVESNVGINKANKNISRAVKINKNAKTRKITVNFHNTNQKPTVSKLTQSLELQPSSEAKINNHLAYVNYQRVLVPSNWNLDYIEYQNIPITTSHEEIITINNNELKQIGFLLTVLEEQEGSLELSFTSPTDFETIYIQKQPGTSATKYILEYNQNISEHTVLKNTKLEYPK